MHTPLGIRRKVSLWLASVCVWTGSSVAAAAPIEFVEQRDTYVIFDDVDGSVENANWFTREPFYVGYQAVEDGFLAAHPDDSQFIVAYTTWRLPQGVGAFYQATANDVHGIGYEHIAPLDAVIPEPYFDDTPNSQVAGFMHMNTWTQFLGDDEGGISDSRISLLFGQELGHAWLSFPHFDDGTGTSDAMLGRSAAHWNFYMHTGGSPVQGHEWTDNGDGTFTAIRRSEFQYSDLDLYLMGLLPADQVAPWFLIENPTNCVDATSGTCPDPGSFQFQSDTFTVTGTRRDISLEQVIASEGPRVPAHGDAPNTFDVSFLLLKRPDETFTEEEKLIMDNVIRRSIEMWEAQTRGLGHIVNRTARGPGGDTDTETSGTGDAGSEDGGTTGEEGESDAESTSDSTTADDSGNSPDETGNLSDDGGGCQCRAQPSNVPVHALALSLCAIGMTLRRRRRR